MSKSKVVSIEAFRKLRDEQERARKMDEIWSLAARIDMEMSGDGEGKTDPAILAGLHVMLRQAAAAYGPPRHLPESERREFVAEEAG